MWHCFDTASYKGLSPSTAPLIIMLFWYALLKNLRCASLAVESLVVVQLKYFEFTVIVSVT